MALNPNQKMMLVFANQALAAGLRISSTSIFSTMQSYYVCMGAHAFPPIDFSEATGPDLGSLEADWDDLIVRGLIPAGQVIN